MLQRLVSRRIAVSCDDVVAVISAVRRCSGCQEVVPGSEGLDLTACIDWRRQSTQHGGYLLGIEG